MYLDIFSFIVDIRPGSEYSSDERNKLFSFSKKVTLKATILGIRMCSAELLLRITTQAVIACYKRLLGQLYQKRYPYTEILTQALSVNFENNNNNNNKEKNTTMNSSTTVPLK